ncbi:hypothetical protein CQW29_11335 [Pantoea coffeiphila]|uniref:Uncharacterized protein n=1 Tax=Pantoea coffeiphila TaxID=1465635 RepID=A0A2S9ICS1_9GAMM|nr:hypothetical protein CQW29_11335 [Pantoea coffeiphila]
MINLVAQQDKLAMPLNERQHYSVFFHASLSGWREKKHLDSLPKEFPILSLKLLKIGRIIQGQRYSPNLSIVLMFFIGAGFCHHS